MYAKWVVALCLVAVIHSGTARPGSKSFASKEDSEAKEWETRKPGVSLLKQLEKSGVGVKRNAADETPEENTRIEVIENAKNSLTTEKVSEEVVESTDLPEQNDDNDAASARIKKQSPNNVCIKVSFY